MSLIFKMLALVLLRCTESSDAKFGIIFDHDSVDAMQIFTKYRPRYISQVIDLSDSFAVSNEICSQLENDVIGIIGVCEKCALATIQSYSDTFQVPFLLISSAPIPDDVTSDSFQFFLTPVFIQGLLDIVIYKQWHRVFYIYDTDEGLAKLYEFYLFFTNVFVNFIGL